LNFVFFTDSVSELYGQRMYLMPYSIPIRMALRTSTYFYTVLTEWFL
jgi:hypothetical protein